MQKSKHCRIQAIASRDLALAKKWAKELGIPKAYGSYEELLADREIEAVYNPLPNHLHVPWSIKAAEAGKHVLCEKPIALDAKEAEQLVAARNRTGQADHRGLHGAQPSAMAAGARAGAAGQDRRAAGRPGTVHLFPHRSGERPQPGRHRRRRPL